MTPRLIGANDIPKWWPAAAPLLEPALATGHGEIDIAQLRLLLIQGRAMLVLVIDDAEVVHGAIALEFTDYPNYRVGHIIATGGAGITEETECWKQIKQWLKQEGCRFVEAYAGDSRARLFKRLGLETVYQVVRSEL